MSEGNLDPDKVPAEIAPVLFYAAKWGVGDDAEREIAIENAPTKQLEQLARCLDDVDNSVLVSWLTGHESRKVPPSPEYVAVTCLTMAVQSAKAMLKQRRRSSGPTS